MPSKVGCSSFSEAWVSQVTPWPVAKPLMQVPLLRLGSQGKSRSRIMRLRVSKWEAQLDASTPKCGTIQGLVMVSIRWYLGCLEGRLRGAGV